MPFHYRVRIAYKGTAFHGWQAQSATPENDVLPSVQGTLVLALRRIAREGRCSVSGTSRTDAGVHAQGQLGKLILPRDLEPAILKRGLNSMIPGTIRIVDCERCDSTWNPKAGPSLKEYHYYFSDCETINPLVADVVAHVPGPLNLQLLTKAASLLVGEHDFYSFSRRSSNAATTVRTLHECTLVSGADAHLMEGVRVLRFVGSGFLKQMVRYLASSLFAVGRGEVSLQELTAQLQRRTDEKLSPKAPACGLHLIAITGV